MAKVRHPRSAPSKTSEAITVADLIRDVARRLVKAKVVFAHGTGDPVA